jgi:hypothetical protein
MHGAMMMLVALGGLGCQNTVGDRATPPPPSLPAIAGPEATPFPTAATPPPYPGYFPVGDPDIVDTDEVGLIRRTFYSFFWGRDPDVKSAREVEASVFGYWSRN